MKKAIKLYSLITIWVISMMPVLGHAQSLQEPRQTIVEYTQVPLHEEILYDEEIKEKEIPEGILNSVKSSYSDHKIATAYRGSDGSYKIILAIENEKMAAFYNAGGDFLKLETETEEENSNEHWR